MASVSHRPLTSTSALCVKGSSALPGTTPPSLRPSHAVDPLSSWPPSSSLPFEPRDASSGTQRRNLPSPSPIVSNLSPPWQRTPAQSDTSPLRQTERDKTASSHYSDPWRPSREPRDFEAGRLPSPKMQSTQNQHAQMYMTPSMLASNSAYAPSQPSYGSSSTNLPFHELMFNPNSFPPGVTFNPTGNEPVNPAAEWGRSSGEPPAQVGPAEYAQAVDIWRHVRAALPHIRSQESPGPPANGQPYRSLFDVANTAVCVLTGVAPKKLPPPTRPPPNALPEQIHKRVRVSNGGDKDKPTTYCRGCGATETPEWRRGPLGPRTLCNACGLVHMKMVRKKKKAEEKAAAEAAAKG